MRNLTVNMRARRWRRRALVLVGLLPFATAGHATDCSDLSSLHLVNAHVESAEVVTAGEFSVTGRGAATVNSQLGELPPFCRVVVSARPSSDSDIGIEVWLPEIHWNGKLLTVGNGAWAGSISYAALAGALARGYAAASTDTGHKGNNAEFAIGHPEKVIDLGYRAVHETAVLAKALTAARFDTRPARSYFEGCSTGGRQALSEAQRYPDDFDGIIAGAPANYVTHLQGYQIWTANIAHRAPGAELDPAELPMLNDAVLAACDTIDGVADGVIENPLRCPFDAATLVCSDSQTAPCLTAEQARTVNSKYTGPTDAEGERLYPGSARGSERVWGPWIGPEPLSLANDTYRYLVFEDPSWDYEDFDFESQVPVALERIGPVMDSNDPHLEPFFEHGGKLLLYHGWNDAGVPPENTINYYESVIAEVGEDATRDAMRLFLVPGMNHCRGGVGTDRFDRLGALDAWVASGSPPESITAARIRDGALERTRPLCAYPSQAVYDGTGNTDDAGSFTCGKP